MDAAFCFDFCQSPWWAIIVNISRFTDELTEPVEPRNALCLITVASNGRRLVFVATFKRWEVCQNGHNPNHSTRAVAHWSGAELAV